MNEEELKNFNDELNALLEKYNASIAVEQKIVVNKKLDKKE